MNAPYRQAVRTFLFACVPLAAALAQEQPAPATAPAPSAPLAVSSQGQAKAPVDIVVSVRHAPPGDSKCDKGAAACPATRHWLVELQAGSAKPALTLDQEAELRKELTSAASPKARLVNDLMLSDATLSLRVPANTPYGIVQNLFTAVARAGICKTEFAVVAADKTEQRLPVPIPTGIGFTIREASDPPEEMRVQLTWDQQKGEVVPQFGKTRVTGGAEGSAHLQKLIADAAEGWRRLGKPETPGIIDAASAVPWQAVVKTIDAFRAASVQQIQFAVPAGK